MIIGGSKAISGLGRDRADRAMTHPKTKLVGNRSVRGGKRFRGLRYFGARSYLALRSKGGGYVLRAGPGLTPYCLPNLRKSGGGWSLRTGMRWPSALRK